MANPQLEFMSDAESLLEMCAEEFEQKCFKRPRNSFFIWCSCMRGVLLKQHPHMRLTDITRLLGKMWRELDESQRTCFQVMAQREKSRFFQKYPDFKYQQTKKHKKLPFHAMLPVQHHANKKHNLCNACDGGQMVSAKCGSLDAGPVKIYGDSQFTGNQKTTVQSYISDQYTYEGVFGQRNQYAVEQPDIPGVPDGSLNHEFIRSDKSERVFTSQTLCQNCLSTEVATICPAEQNSELLRYLTSYTVPPPEYTSHYTFFDSGVPSETMINSIEEGNSIAHVNCFASQMVDRKSSTEGNNTIRARVGNASTMENDQIHCYDSQSHFGSTSGALMRGPRHGKTVSGLPTIEQYHSTNSSTATNTETCERQCEYADFKVKEGTVSLPEEDHCQRGYNSNLTESGSLMKHLQTVTSSAPPCCSKIYPRTMNACYIDPESKGIDKRYSAEESPSTFIDDTIRSQATMTWTDAVNCTQNPSPAPETAIFIDRCLEERKSHLQGPSEVVISAETISYDGKRQRDKCWYTEESHGYLGTTISDSHEQTNPFQSGRENGCRMEQCSETESTVELFSNDRTTEHLHEEYVQDGRQETNQWIVRHFRALQNNSAGVQDAYPSYCACVDAKRCKCLNSNLQESRTFQETITDLRQEFSPDLPLTHYLPEIIKWSLDCL